MLVQPHSVVADVDVHNYGLLSHGQRAHTVAGSDEGREGVAKLVERDTSDDLLVLETMCRGQSHLKCKHMGVTGGKFKFHDSMEEEEDLVLRAYT